MSKAYYRIDELDLLPERTRLGVIGNPIAHSKSPAMQQAALDFAKIDCRYVRLECGMEEGDFPRLTEQLAQRGFLGLNVTVPFKRQAYLQASEHDALSTLCEASNTLVRRGHTWHAFNTDGPGFQLAIEHKTARRLQDLSIVILGSCGGAGSAIAAQAAIAACPRIILVNRPRPELEAQHDLLHRFAPHLRIEHYSFDHPSLQDAVREADLIVNATSLGLHKNDAMPLPLNFLQPHHFVYDIVPHETAFNHAAAEKNCLCSTGEDMLLWQGALSFEHWFDRKAHIKAMQAGLCANP